MNSTHRLSRDCPATLIPAGTPVHLPAGSEVTVVQALGGSVTVRAADGLYRIAGSDSGAIEGYVPVASVPAAPAPAGEFSEASVWEALRAVFDPEIPVNIVDLGLVYDLHAEPGPAGQAIEIKMTLTAPGCGMGPVIAEDARQKVAAQPGVASAKVHIVWDPIWTPHMISEAGRRKLGLE